MKKIPLRTYINVHPLPYIVKMDELNNFAIDPMINEGNLDLNNVMDRVILIVLTKVLDEMAQDTDKELPLNIGVIWTQNNFRKGYCINMEGSIPRSILWRYFESEKMECPTENGVKFDDLMKY